MPWICVHNLKDVTEAWGKVVAAKGLPIDSVDDPFVRSGRVSLYWRKPRVSLYVLTASYIYLGTCRKPCHLNNLTLNNQLCYALESASSLWSPSSLWSVWRNTYAIRTHLIIMFWHRYMFSNRMWYRTWHCHAASPRSYVSHPDKEGSLFWASTLGIVFIYAQTIYMHFNPHLHSDRHLHYDPC